MKNSKYIDISECIDISKCRHGHKCLCLSCDYYTDCEVTKIFVDANVILAHYFEESGANIFRKILNHQRDSYRIVISNDIFGEICNKLFEEKIKEEYEYSKLGHKKLAPRMDDVLKKFINISRLFIITDISYCNKEFLELLRVINKSGTLKCGNTDQLHVCMAIYLGLPFYTFDEAIEDDYTAINKNIKDVTDKKLVLKTKKNI